MSSNYAVLTGDVIESRRLSAPQLNIVFESVRDLWLEFGKVHPGCVVGSLEVFRGDGWQIAMAEPFRCVEAAVFLRAAFKAQRVSFRIDSRMGVGVGSVPHIDPERLRESNGEAFHRSGAVLERLERRGPRWAIDVGDSKNSRLPLSIAFSMMDLLIHRWTQPAAAAVVGSILGLTQDEIAAHHLSAKKDGTQPTQQAVNDALKRIAWASHWEPALKQTTELLKEDL